MNRKLYFLGFVFISAMAFLPLACSTTPTTPVGPGTPTAIPTYVFTTVPQVTCPATGICAQVAIQRSSGLVASNTLQVGLSVSGAAYTTAAVTISYASTSIPMTYASTGGGQAVYNAAAAWSYIPGTLYTVSITAGAYHATSGVTAPGNITQAPNGSQVSWTNEGNFDYVEVWSGSGFNYLSGFPDLSDVNSPVVIPYAATYTSSGTYNFTTVCQNVQVVYGTNFGMRLVASDTLWNNVNISYSPTNTGTPTQTGTPTRTPTPTWTSTIGSPTGTFTSTSTPSLTNTRTITPTPTFTVTYTPTFTMTNTFTPTVTNTVPPMLVGCSTDAIIGPASGKFAINNTFSIVPLCSGWVLYGDRINNKIQAVNAVDGYVGTSYALTGTPEDLAYDGSTGLLYAILNGMNSVAVVNLNTSAVSYITLPAPGAHVAAASGGKAFVALDDSTYDWPGQIVYYVNGSTASTIAPVTLLSSFNGSAFIACNSAGTTLYLAVQGGSGYPTYQFSFNTNTHAFSQQEQVTGYDSNGNELVLSPDGNHLVYPNGGGNGSSPYYTIFDLDPTNINNNLGAFNTGAYPVGGGFSPDSANFATTNSADLMVFSVSGHTSSKTTWVNPTGGGTDSLAQAWFSRGGGFVYALGWNYGSTTSPATIVYETFP